MRGVGRILVALLRQRRRLALATLAIALSIGYLAGALTLLERVGAGLDRLATSSGERADLVVEGDVAYESPVEQVRRLVPSALADRLAAVPGVRSVSPRVEDVAVLVGPDGRPLVAPGLTEQPLGANWPDDDAVAPWELVAGRPPRTGDEVVVDERSARRAGVGIGDGIGVAGKAKVGNYRVAGIVRDADGGGLPAGASLALFTTDEARVLFDRPTDDNSVAVRLRPGADSDTVASRIRVGLPAGAELVDGTTAARHRQESLSRSFTIVRALVMGFAGLALVVGMATVANSLSLLYAQRRRTFAELRLVGARRNQLLVAALVEAALLAVVASLVGVPLGILLGRLIEAALGALDTAVPVAGSWLSAPALLTAVVVGIAATVVAAVVPAVRACRVPPVESVSEVPPTVPGSTRVRRVAVAVVAVTAAAVAGAVAAAVTVRPSPADVVGLQGEGPDVGVVVLAAGVAGVVVVALSFLPRLLAASVSAGVRLLPVRPAPLRQMAARDVARNRSRTAATTGALILAAGVVGGLAVFLASFSASVEGEVDRIVTADLVVDSGTFTRGGLPADLLQQLGSVDGVAAVSGWQVGRGTIVGRPVRLTGLDVARLDRVLSPRWVEAPVGLDAGSILLDRAVAADGGWEVGDLVPVTFTSGGVEQLRLAGTYEQGSLLLGEAVVDRSVVTRQVPATSDIAALVAVRGAAADGGGPASAAADVRRLSARYGIDRVLAPADFVDSRAELLRGFERVIQWMLLFTLVQALVGVVNTLLLSVGERRRELGLLRVAGASRRQVRRLVLLEGTSLAVVGTFVGLCLGLVGAALAVRSLGSLGVDTFVAPAGTLAVTGLAAVTLGVVATAVPARWAAGVPPLDAVVDQGGLRSRPRPVQRPRWYKRGRPGFRLHDLTVAPGTVEPGAVVAPVLPAAVAAGVGALPGRGVPGTVVPAGAVPRTLTPGATAAGAPSSPPRTAPPSPPPASPSTPSPPPASPPTPPPFAPPDLASPPTPRPFAPPLPPGATPPVPVAPPATPGPVTPTDPARLGRPGRLLVEALAAGESLRYAVTGRARGLPCAVALTDRRVLVVADRPHRPLVQSLHPGRTGMSLHRVRHDAPLSLVVLDGDRMLELTGVTDVETASVMCVVPR